MDTISINDVEVDRCEKCHGLFFDHLEKETLRSMEGAESIDIGDDFVGATCNEILDVACPKCQTKMPDQNARPKWNMYYIRTGLK